MWALIALLCMQALLQGATSIEQPNIAVPIDAPMESKFQTNNTVEIPLIEKNTLPVNSTAQIPLNQSTKAAPDLSFSTGFVEALVMIFFAEFGDRSFMLIVLFTMKLKNKLLVFFPSIIMMMIMHCVSVAFGAVFTMLFDRVYILIASVILFLGFGTKLIYDACTFKVSGNKDIQESLNIKEGKTKKDEDNVAMERQINANLHEKSKNSLYTHKPIDEEKASVMTLLTLLFIADWGDRCQIAAVVLTATRNIWGVAVGGAIGMGLCCALASGCGMFLSGRISEKTTMYIGAILFYLFAVESSWEAYKEW